MRRQARWTAIGLVTLCIACPPAMAVGHLSGSLPKPAYVQSVATRDQPKTGPYLSQTMKKNPAYARALNALLDHADALPEWAQGMGRGKGWGVEASVAKVTIDGTTYELYYTCESQNCNVSELIVMFAPNAAQAWGVLSHEGRISYLGAPNAAQQKALKQALGPDE